MEMEADIPKLDPINEDIYHCFSPTDYGAEIPPKDVRRLGRPQKNGAKGDRSVKGAHVCPG
jgi:hypothetical protein